MTPQSRSTLQLNLDSFHFLVEQVLPQVHNGLQFWSPRHTGTDRDEHFFFEMRRKCRELDALKFWSTYWSAAQVQLWCAVPQSIRGFPVRGTRGGNTDRGYDSHIPSLSHTLSLSALSFSSLLQYFTFLIHSSTSIIY